MAGFEALLRDSNQKKIEFDEVVERIIGILEKKDRPFAKKTKYILWQSYRERCNFIHGKVFDNERIQKLIPKLQLILKKSIVSILLSLDGQTEGDIVENVHVELISDG